MRPIKDKRLLLMKMRQSAIPGDPRDQTVHPPPPNERLFVRLKRKGSDEYENLWLRKAISAGRAIDALTATISFRVTEAQCVVLCVVREERLEPIKNDQLLMDQLEDGDELTLVAQSRNTVP